MAESVKDHLAKDTRNCMLIRKLMDINYLGTVGYVTKAIVTTFYKK